MAVFSAGRASLSVSGGPAILNQRESYDCDKGRFARFQGEVNIQTARKMKFYCPEAALGLAPVMIEKDSAIGVVITIEVGKGKRLPEWRQQVRRRREIRSRQCSREAVLRPKR